MVRVWLWLACVILLMADYSAHAQVDIFMSIGGSPSPMGANPQTPPLLQGDSLDAQYPKWIQLTSVQMGAGRGISLSSGTVSASDPSLSEVTISKMTDSTTPSLFVLCCGGTATVSQPINYVTIDFRKTGSSQVFYRLQLQNVYVSGASTSGGGGIPSESLSLFYTKISWSYVTFDQYSKVQSTVTKGWDVVKNAAF
jgi:type VI secretion system secreted protein Hcp